MTSKDSRSRKQKETNKLTVPLNIGSDHIRSSINNAPVTLLEYGDYECPYAGMAYPVVKEIMREYGDNKICFVFRSS
jgi:protein-disulfide isomerase